MVESTAGVFAKAEEDVEEGIDTGLKVRRVDELAVGARASGVMDKSLTSCSPVVGLAGQM